MESMQLKWFLGKFSDLTDLPVAGCLLLKQHRVQQTVMSFLFLLWM